MKPTAHLGSIGDIDEPAIAFVEIKEVCLPEKVVWEKYLFALRHLGILNIVPYVNVEEAIVIVIAPGDTRTESSMSNASSTRRKLLEPALTVVPIKDVRLVVSHVEISVAIVIVIAEGTAHPPPRIANASRFGDIGEGAIAVVAIERVLRQYRPRFRPHRGAIDEVKIQVIIVIVVSPRRTGTDECRDNAQVNPTRVFKSDARLFGNVHKLDV